MGPTKHRREDLLRGGARCAWLLGLALALCLGSARPLSLVMASPTAAQPPISTGDGGWVWQNPLPQGNALVAVAFPNAAVGWAVALDGTILRTADGGASWAAQRSGITALLTGVAAVDAQTAWVVGLPGTILRTADGGASWIVQPSARARLLGVAAAGAQTAWAVGFGGTILRTAAAGASSSAPTAASAALPITSASRIPC